ncbi:hypothetical protein OG568_08920 [Streptomyces sp. NBC_01450]|uniref:hypothetical protein n=1 Tax=Streptomyces sp. NBC_01450 TaxID=2903871 RepID=UPI002E353F03|nr:hypothetical protein [Streptomyces sp. NBC_01450]
MGPVHARDRGAEWIGPTPTDSAAVAAASAAVGCYRRMHGVPSRWCAQRRTDVALHRPRTAEELTDTVHAVGTEAASPRAS